MDPRSLTNDFKEFLKLLNARAVEYLVIGGHAVAFHGYPRATNDLDVWIAVNAQNARRVVSALIEFGFPSSAVEVSTFLKPDQVVRMGMAPNRIEIQTGIDGVHFEDCLKNKRTADLDGIPVPFIGLQDLKTNKKASGRNKDLADLDELP